MGVSDGSALGGLVTDGAADGWVEMVEAILRRWLGTATVAIALLAIRFERRSTLTASLGPGKSESEIWPRLGGWPMRDCFRCRIPL